MNKEIAVNELKNALNFIAGEYDCDDRDLNVPNPDGISIAINYLAKHFTKDALQEQGNANTSTNKHMPKCSVCGELLGIFVDDKPMHYKCAPCQCTSA